MFNFSALGMTREEGQKVILERVSDEYLQRMIEFGRNKKIVEDEISRRKHEREVNFTGVKNSTI